MRTVHDRRHVSCFLFVAFVTACRSAPPAPEGADKDGFSAPTPQTVSALEEARRALPADDGADRAEAERGFLAREPSLRTLGKDSAVIFDQDGYRFITGEAPQSVHPSLWRQASLNNLHGVYKVTDGVFQVRGYDLATMSLIEGRTGWIVVDPLTAHETAARAFAFARKTLGDRPVSAIVFTHSHVDHFGGALAIASQADVDAGKVRVIAPEGFLEEATSENVLAGPAMGRRALYMYGRDLPRSPRGKVDNGLGKEPATGTIGILRPTTLVSRTPQREEIDGVVFDFQYTPASEAPAELTFYLPARKAFCGAEIVSRTLHNLYTLRGAKVRDARRWAGYIDEALDRFPDAEVLFMSHHWPVFGKERLAQMLREQRDTYRYIHDQTLRLANQGYGPREIAEQLTLPKSLMTHYWNRGYYGTVKHDAKAVYQMYFGWYDGNPSQLDPLPRIEAARHYVEFMGGAPPLLVKARASFDKGEYRWVAEVLSHLVAVQPDHAEAKALLARAYEQLGYRSESTAWRNAYLTGSHELRRGRPQKGIDIAGAAELLGQTAPNELVQMLQVTLNGPKADGVSLVLNLTFSDLSETYVLRLENAVLHARKQAPVPDANTSLTLTRSLLVRVITRQVDIKDLITSPELTVEGSKLDLVRFFSLLDRPDLTFPIVTPKE